MPEPRAAAVISGGGIGGLAAALALAACGRPSIVAERRAVWSEAGAGIQLSPNAVQALEWLGVARRLEPQAARPSAIMVREAATARLLQRLPLGDWIAARHGAPYWLVHRRDLQAALVEAVAEQPAITVVHAFEAAAFEQDRHRVRVRSVDGRELEGVAVIGADGVFSRVRQQLFAPPAPRFSGRTAARTVIPAPTAEAARAWLDVDATGVWLAPGAHVVHYPVRAGREVAVVVVRTEAWDERGWSLPASAETIERALSAVAPRLAAAIGKGHTWRRWALFETDPLPRWTKGRVTLLGDAAHPTLPFLAQGGALALEDAVTLAACLSGGDDDIAAALLSYEAARAKRAGQVVAAARRNGHVFHLRGPAALARNTVMRLLPGERVMAGYDWVYGWRPS